MSTSVIPAGMSPQEFLAEGAEIAEPEIPQEEIPEEVTDETSEEVPEEEKSEEEKAPDAISVLTEQVNKFEEVFATPEDAQAAANAVEYYNQFSSAVLNGRADVFFTEVAKANPEGASEFSRNFLPVIQKMNPDLYSEITLPVVKNLLRAAIVFNDGDTERSTNVQNAARVLSHILFNSLEVPNDPQRRPDPAKEELNRERQEFFNSQKGNFLGELSGQTSKLLTDSILDGLDPNNAMNEITKEALVNKITAQVKVVLNADRTFQNKMHSLLAKAESDRFNKKYAWDMHKLFESKVKAIIPGIRQEERKKAMVTKTAGKAPNQLKRTPGVQPGKSSKEVDWSKTKSSDFMAGNDAKIFYK